jgi:hypothetical protein
MDEGPTREQLNATIAQARKSNRQLRHAAPYLFVEWQEWQRAVDELRRARLQERAMRDRWVRSGGKV